MDAVLSAAQPDCMINTAAYNLVDKAEDEPVAAFSANALGPRNLADWCAQANVPLVHVSTDYVFGAADAPHEPHRETELPFPACAYAMSKLDGEVFRPRRVPEAFRRPDLWALRPGIDRWEREFRQDDAATGG